MKKPHRAPDPATGQTQPCPRCKGTGRIPDPHAIGAAMKARRIAARLTLREVARRMGFTAPYISDLENGRRPWNDVALARYATALVDPS